MRCSPLVTFPSVSASGGSRFQVPGSPPAVRSCPSSIRVHHSAAATVGYGPPPRPGLLRPVPCRSLESPSRSRPSVVPYPEHTTEVASWQHACIDSPTANIHAGAPGCAGIPKSSAMPSRSTRMYPASPPAKGAQPLASSPGPPPGAAAAAPPSLGTAPLGDAAGGRGRWGAGRSSTPPRPRASSRADNSFIGHPGH